MQKTRVQKSHATVPLKEILFRQRQDLPRKAAMLDFSAILENGAAMRPDTNIVGGSVRQDFDLDKRLDYTVLQASPLDPSKFYSDFFLVFGWVFFWLQFKNLCLFSFHNFFFYHN